MRLFGLLKIEIKIYWIWILLLMFCVTPTYGNIRSVCNEIAQEVEYERGLPANILRSIAFVEAGRRQPDGTVEPWPWSLNHAGRSLFFESKHEAIKYLENNITADFKNIDVGCMQINVRWHREHFGSFSLMIDPQKNIQYAATFLSSLKKIHGSWEEAIKHYHSATPKLNRKYFAKVDKVWSKTKKDKIVTQKAKLFLDENIVYRSEDAAPNILYQSSLNKDIAENKKEVLNLSDLEQENANNHIYLNAVLIENNKRYDEKELKRYIRYKSAFLGKKIDMILLFRKEFSAGL